MRRGVLLMTLPWWGCMREIRPTGSDDGAAATLARLSAEYWDGQMARFPEWATFVGDHRFDDRLGDLGDEARAAHVKALRGFERRLDAVATGRLGERDLATREALRVALRDEIVVEGDALHRWKVDPLSGPQVDFPQTIEFHPRAAPRDHETLLARFRAFPRLVDQHVANLRAGLAAGLTAPRVLVERAGEQTRRLADEEPGETPFDAAAKDGPPEARAAVATDLLPAYRRLADFFQKELLPAARASVGIGALPGGDAAYRHAIRQHTGTEMEPQALHDLGLREVARIEVRMREVASRLGISGTPADITRKLREDPSLRAADRAALLDRARAIVARAQAALPRLSGRLPKTPIELRPIEDYRERESPAAYYYSAPEDATRPAIYYVNTYEPASRPLYNFEALSFHEAVPGHHLQVALAQEITDLPRFRRHGGPTAFVEGWALYSEGLAEEAGLYSDDRMLVGRCAYEMWRACRLVVDTGLHAFSWTRERAIAYLVDHTGLPEIEATNEIDRYIAWPGQALAYKIGELEIRRLRAEAERRLGASFNLREFHDLLLGEGALPMDVVAGRVMRWIAQEGG